MIQARSSFACPVDHTPFETGDAHPGCSVRGNRYPVVNGIPVLLDEENSVFRKAR